MPRGVAIAGGVLTLLALGGSWSLPGASAGDGDERLGISVDFKIDYSLARESKKYVKEWMHDNGSSHEMETMGPWLWVGEKPGAHIGLANRGCQAIEVTKEWIGACIEIGLEDGERGSVVSQGRLEDLEGSIVEERPGGARTWPVHLGPRQETAIFVEIRGGRLIEEVDRNRYYGVIFRCACEECIREFRTWTRIGGRFGLREAVDPIGESLAHCARGRALKIEGKLVEAEGEFRKSIAADKRTLCGIMALTQLLMEQDRLEECKAVIEEHVPEMPAELAAKLRGARKHIEARLSRKGDRGGG